MNPDALTAIATLSATEDAVDAFLATLRGAGFSAAVAGGWTGEGPAAVHRFYFNTWPEAWMRLYAEAGLFGRDPVVAHSRHTHLPFLWTEAEAVLLRYPGGEECGRLFREYGWSEVFSVPVHAPGRYQGLVTMAATEAPVLPPGRLAWLAALARAIHDRCHQTPGFGARLPDRPRLTARQIACLREAARGAGDKEIGRRLGLSPATAHYHIEGAKRALGVRSRTEAVAILALDGLLEGEAAEAPAAADAPQADAGRARLDGAARGD